MKEKEGVERKEDERGKSVEKRMNVILHFFIHFLLHPYKKMLINDGHSSRLSNSMSEENPEERMEIPIFRKRERERKRK